MIPPLHKLLDCTLLLLNPLAGTLGVQAKILEALIYHASFHWNFYWASPESYNIFSILLRIEQAILPIF
jgi:hypothetical protein